MNFKKYTRIEKYSQINKSSRSESVHEFEKMSMNLENICGFKMVNEFKICSHFLRKLQIKKLFMNFENNRGFEKHFAYS